MVVPGGVTVVGVANQALAALVPLRVTVLAGCGGGHGGGGDGGGKTVETAAATKPTLCPLSYINSSIWSSSAESPSSTGTWKGQVHKGRAACG